MRPGVPASEAGPRPPCKCHGKPMRWNMRADLTAGGFWRCVVRDLDHSRKWRVANRDRLIANNKAWQAANIEHRRQYQRRWRYGITAEEYDALAARQGNRCALCDIPAIEAPKGSLHIDHDHATGRIRGLICLRCNSALERVEMAGWLARVEAYLT